MTTLTRNTDILRAEVKAHLDANCPELAFERFGLPVAVLRIAVNIFEALPDEEGRAFFAALLDAIERDGKDLSRVHWAFLAAELKALPATTPEVQAVIDPVIAGMELLADGKEWAKDAAFAAYAAADAAADAAYAAAFATDDAYAADDAAFAAYAAADAAYAAADAAADAAYADAYAAVRIRQRDTLLRLISEAV